MVLFTYLQKIWQPEIANKYPLQQAQNLTDEDIEKAVKDAEAHASEDKKRKEEIEVRNNAESLVYNSQKTIDEIRW